MKKIQDNVYIGVILLLFSSFFFSETFKMKEGTARFPRIILGIFVFLSICLIIKGIIETKKGKTVVRGLPLKVIDYPFAVFFIIVIYTALINFIGFFPSTVLFVPCLMYFYRVRQWKTILLTTAGINVFIYVLFVMELNVTLP